YHSLLHVPHHPTHTLFPYTTLFRSKPKGGCFSFPSTGTGEDEQDRKPSLAPAPSNGRGGEGRERTLHERYRSCPFARSSGAGGQDRKSTRLNSSHLVISYAVFCLKK